MEITNKSLIIVIAALLILNVAKIPLLHQPLIFLFNGSLSAYDILFMIGLGWIGTQLGTPFREIIGVVILLWLLSTLGPFLFVGWISNFLMFVLIVMLVASFF